MDASTEILASASAIYARSGVADPQAATRPPIFRTIGIILAVCSGLFIGTSFVVKKFGLLKANEKYNEEPGEGYGYLKNFWWWGGMTLMILGEILNFVAYAFTDAILVTPLGALSVVVATILSAIFLKERLSMVGKVACFLCIVGSVVIVLNVPENSPVANIQQMQGFVIHPAFLSYAGVIIVGSIIAAFYAGPRWGKKNMLVYISICSWVGGLSVVAIQGLGAAIIAQAGGTPQFNQWFLYVLFVFVVCTLVTEIIFLNKALNIFNAALVTPTYYVYFTTTTIISSIVLFRGFSGTPVQIITMIGGFLTICAGVVLLQLSKSAKDVPDTALFKGDLDQIQTIAEQREPETEPKADAIRGTAAIVRRISQARQRWEAEELKRLHEAKVMEQLEPVGEGSTRPGTHSPSRSSGLGAPFTEPQHTPHPPLGMSHFPTLEEMAAWERESDVLRTPNFFANIAGTIRGRSRGGSTLSTAGFPSENKLGSPMQPFPLTEIAVPGQHPDEPSSHQGSRGHRYGLAPTQDTEYHGAEGRLAVPGGSGDSLSASPRRQFSFQNIFRRHTPPPPIAGEEHPSPDRSLRHSRPVTRHRGYSNQQAKSSTEEERIGLVKGDSRVITDFPRFEEAEEEGTDEDKTRVKVSPPVDTSRYGRGITTPPRRGSDERGSDGSESSPRPRGHNKSRSGSRSRSGSQSGTSHSHPLPPLPAEKDRPPGGAFI
ncbi:related to DUF803 domain membrane protein [Cephalotrichum gorgonifer]|uniref:Related to DUF803 domain membrane protein n=1 Tax=Cephalotrichum gorgonifer TaxID=2041049 RepID=A0AAE8MTQ9_9PEZI|nr:related to DUF803 domain membrane protein [Cephalotrichum gorgonifer]